MSGYRWTSSTSIVRSVVAEGTGSIEVRVGRIGRPHGVRGALTVALYTDEPDRRFAEGQRLTDANSFRSWTVAKSHWHQGRLLLSLEGVEDRNAAEALRGVELMASTPADEAAEGPEEYWDRQLIGLGVLSAEGESVGTIVSVAHPPAQDLLEIELSGGGRTFVPFVRALVPEVDLGAGTVTLAPVEGLLDPADTSS